MHMPSYAVLMAEIKKSNPEFETAASVVVSKNLFDLLLKIAISASEFDERFYLEQNPDVRAAIAKGVLKTGREHFINKGFSEGRHGADPVVDEKWYLAAYPDVAKAVKTGKIGSASEHYAITGWREGRAANAQTEKDVKFWLAMLQP